MNIYSVWTLLSLLTFLEIVNVCRKTNMAVPEDCEGLDVFLLVAGCVCFPVLWASVIIPYRLRRFTAKVVKVWKFLVKERNINKKETE